MAFNNNVQSISGRAYWAKILKLVPAYDPSEKQWVIDVSPDAKSLSKLQSLGLGSKLKDDDKGTHDRQRYIVFKRREFKRDSTTKNQPITVKDADGNPWDNNVLIGNGSEVTVEFNTYDTPARGRFPASKGVAILEVTVDTLVPYVKAEKEQSSNRKPVDSSQESWAGDVA